MKRKIILGILSCDPYNEKEAFLEQMVLNGFFIYSISSKIEEVSKYLIKSKDVSKKDIDGIRNRGYNVNKLYWINLLLTSIPDEKSNIIIRDLWEDDLYEGYITPIVSDPILVPNIKFVAYPKNEEIKRWIKKIEEKLYNTK